MCLCYLQANQASQSTLAARTEGMPYLETSGQALLVLLLDSAVWKHFQAAQKCLPAHPLALLIAVLEQCAQQCLTLGYSGQALVGNTCRHGSLPRGLTSRYSGLRVPPLAMFTSFSSTLMLFSLPGMQSLLRACKQYSCELHDSRLPAKDHACSRWLRHHVNIQSRHIGLMLELEP